jgi:3-dehydroquinate synthetase/shikimate kinase
MDAVLVGLPGSGKSVVGRALAARQGAAFIDLDEVIEREAGRPITDIFATEGETGFRALERRAVEALGAADAAPSVGRVIAPGGGAVIDPANRWLLYRGRRAFWLDAPSVVLAERLKHSPLVRPLVAGSTDVVAALEGLRAARERFYGAATWIDASVSVDDATAAIEGHLTGLSRPPAVEPKGGGAGAPGGTALLRATTRIGRLVLGEGVAAAGVHESLIELGAGRALLLSEPAAWRFAGERIAERLRSLGWRVELVLLPRGEAAKRLAVVERTARALARLRAERGEPLVAIGGGALGDTAGLVAATYLRGVPVIQVPTTLVAQIDSAIGGKTAVDLPEGKNLVGAFHQPAAIVVDVTALATLPVRQRRAALGEAVKMAVLGDERLFELLEADGAAIARGTPAAFESGAVAEIVERAAWAKVEVVLADEREAAGRIALNLGHSIGHALEAATGYRGLLHGEAVAYGIRGACRIGVELGVTPAARAARVEQLLDRLGLGRQPLPCSVDTVLGAMATDKKHAGGQLRWVIPTAGAVAVRTEVADSVVRGAVGSLLEAGSPGRAVPVAAAARATIRRPAAAGAGEAR